VFPHLSTKLGKQKAHDKNPIIGILWGIFFGEARIQKCEASNLHTELGSSCPATPVAIPFSVATAQAWSIAVKITGHAHMTSFIKVLLSIVA
jgi:hypothetical protein